MSVNDTAERSVVAMTGHLQFYGKIGLINTGGVSQVRVNGKLSRGFDTGWGENTKWVEVIFHDLSAYMRLSLVKMHIEDAPVACADNILDLSKQQTAKKMK